MPPPMVVVVVANGGGSNLELHRSLIIIEKEEDMRYCLHPNLVRVNTGNFLCRPHCFLPIFAKLLRGVTGVLSGKQRHFKTGKRRILAHRRRWEAYCYFCHMI
ncbi:hypothetical protein L6452_03578 [Arctium lappa]|uniref:Uncharacterized protein n=1 Tax=Arctium lappa TaxID=4217 RepID=A0ACB9FN73_ARCLA|nr:hypothetical protein L6452_03578 [Arctium lappa]